MKRFKICIISLVLIASFVLCGFGVGNKDKKINVFEGVVRRVASESYHKAPRYIVQSDDGVRKLFIGDHDYNIPPEASNQLLAIEGDRVIIKYYNPDEIIGFEILEMA